MACQLTLYNPWRHLLAKFAVYKNINIVDSSKKSSYLKIRGKGLQFYITEFTIKLNLLFRLTVVLDRSSKTEGLIYKIRLNVCHHFEILCKLVLRTKLLLRSSSCLFCRVTHCVHVTEVWVVWCREVCQTELRELRLRLKNIECQHKTLMSNINDDIYHAVKDVYDKVLLSLLQDISCVIEHSADLWLATIGHRKDKFE